LARTRNQRRDTSTRHQELNREVKRSCGRDKMVYFESEAERAEEVGRRGDVRTLYEITRRTEWEIPEYVSVGEKCGRRGAEDSAE